MPVELISAHIPKTAGTSFRSALIQIYGEANILWDYDDAVEQPGSLFNKGGEAWDAYRQAYISKIHPRIRVIHGHFSPCKYAGYFPKAKRIAWIRNPVSRLVSHFFHWKNVPPEVEPMNERKRTYTLSDFIRIDALQNVLSTRWFRQMRLYRFDFVGIFEHYQEEFNYLSKLMKWPAVTIPFQNKNRGGAAYESFKLDLKTYEEIYAIHNDDIQLYNEALRLRAQRIK